MPSVTLPDWIIGRLAELEHTYGKADLLVGPRRDWALVELLARKTPVAVGDVVVNVGQGLLAVFNVGPEPARIVDLQGTGR